MLEIKTKSITRENWPRILERSFVCESNLTPVFQGVIALIRIEKVQEPLQAFSCRSPVTLADNGYRWIQLAPENEHWWLTAMLDAEKKLVQYYFDITLENRIRGRDSEFDDLFLDVVAMPDGRCELLDEEELNEALRMHLITQKQYNLAKQTASTLLKTLPERIEDLNCFILSCLNILESKQLPYHDKSASL